MAISDIDPDKKYYKTSEVCERFGFCRSTLYRLIKKGKFPPPVTLEGSSLVRWTSEDVKRYDETLAKKKPDKIPG